MKIIKFLNKLEKGAFFNHIFMKFFLFHSSRNGQFLICWWLFCGGEDVIFRWAVDFCGPYLQLFFSKCKERRGCSKSRYSTSGTVEFLENFFSKNTCFQEFLCFIFLHSFIFTSLNKNDENLWTICKFLCICNIVSRIKVAILYWRFYFSNSFKKLIRSNNIIC